MSRKRELEGRNEQISKLLGEHRDSWRIGVIEGMGAAAVMARELGQQGVCSAICTEMKRRFGHDAKAEFRRRNLV